MYSPRFQQAKIPCCKIQAMSIIKNRYGMDGALVFNLLERANTLWIQESLNGSTVASCRPREGWYLSARGNQFSLNAPLQHCSSGLAVARNNSQRNA